MNEITRVYRCSPGKSMPSLLTFLGVPKERVYARYPHYHGIYRSFWYRYADRYELEELLADAKKLYHQKCKELRTDQTANHEEAVKVIKAWQRLQNICRNHGIVI